MSHDWSKAGVFEDQATLQAWLTDIDQQVYGGSIPAPATTWTFGHSYALGTGMGITRDRFGWKFAQLLGSTESNWAVSGVSLADHATGGWESLLQNLPGSTSTNATEKLLAAIEVAVFCWGINDLNRYGPDHLDGFKNALRTVVSRARVSAVYEDTDASVAFTGTWSQTNTATENSGSSYHSTATNGDSYTITVPSNVPSGSTIAIGMTGRTNSQGAVHTFTVNGVAAGSISAINAQTTGYIGYVFRIAGVNPGDTIVGTVSSVATITSFDYWQVEANPAPVVLIQQQPYCPDYSAYGAGGAQGPPTDAGVDTLNGIISSVAAEFDSAVIVVAPPTTIQHNSAYFQADKLHPNELGHGLIAQGLFQAYTKSSAPKNLAGTTLAAKNGLRLPQAGLFATNLTGSRVIDSLAVIGTNGAIAGYLPVFDTSAHVTDAAHDRNEIRLTGEGFTSETFQRALNSSHITPATGVARFSSIGLRAGDVVTNIYVACTNVGSGITLFKVGLYDKTGAQLGVSADFKASLATGLLTIPLGTPYTVPADDAYMVGVLETFSTSAAQLEGTGALSGSSVRPGSSAWPYAQVSGLADLTTPLTFVASASPIWFAVA